LVIILVFGLILNNNGLFFKGWVAKWVNEDALQNTLNNFKVVTLETAFVVRTFFFIIFGISITLGNLLSFRVFAISMLILGGMFLIRFVLIRLFERKNIGLKSLIAPRGLITVLLFYAIPTQFEIEGFDSGILLYVMLITALLMSYSLIQHSRRDVFEELVEEAEHDGELLDSSDDSESPEEEKAKEE